MLCGLEEPQGCKDEVWWGRCSDCQNVYHMHCVSGRKRSTLLDKQQMQRDDPRCDPCKIAKTRLIIDPTPNIGLMFPDRLYV